LSRDGAKPYCEIGGVLYIKHVFIPYLVF
jgi:hypothetical protein